MVWFGRILCFLLHHENSIVKTPTQLQPQHNQTLNLHLIRITKKKEQQQLSIDFENRVIVKIYNQECPL